MLNILPSTKKSQIQKEQIYGSIRSAALLVISFFIVADGLLFGAKTITEGWLTQLQTEASAVTIAAEEQTKIEADLNELSSIMSALNQTQKNYQNPVAVIIHLVGALPQDISIEKLDILYDSESVEVHGIAADRDTFITLQEDLNATPFLSDINFEVTSFTQKQDIPFEFNALINYDAIQTN